MIKLTRPACPHPTALAAGNYKHPKNKDALVASTDGKCMYCETKISQVSFGHVEHIKPKAENLFPELEFEWSNLGYVCDRCNNAKSNKYNAATEFINPYEEDPSASLMAYGSLLFPRDASARGELTINEIQLNRAELVERRNERIKHIQKAYVAAQRAGNPAVWESAIKELRKEAEADKEYSYVAKALLDHLDVPTA